MAKKATIRYQPDGNSMNTSVRLSPELNRQWKALAYSIGVSKCYLLATWIESASSKVSPTINKE